MLFKLLIVSAASGAWSFALRVSDKLTSGKWLALSFVNLVLLLLFVAPYKIGNSVNLNSISHSEQIVLLDVAACDTGITSSDSTISQQSIKTNIFKDARIEFYFAGHGVIGPDRDAPALTSFDRRVGTTALIVGVDSYSAGSVFNFATDDSIQIEKTLDTYLADFTYGFPQSLASLQDEFQPGRFRYFWPPLSSGNFSRPNEDSLFKQIVYYTPLGLCVIQFFTLILTFISLHRKWAERVQLELSNEKLRLEIELLKEERNKGEPKIVIVQR